MKCLIFKTSVQLSFGSAVPHTGLTECSFKLEFLCNYYNPVCEMLSSLLILFKLLIITVCYYVSPLKSRV